MGWPHVSLCSGNAFTATWAVQVVSHPYAAAISTISIPVSAATNAPGTLCGHPRREVRRAAPARIAIAADLSRFRASGDRLEIWLVDIARPALRDNAWDACRVAVRVHALPVFGEHRLDKLRSDHLRTLYHKIIASGRAASTVHRTLRTAVDLAVESGYMVRNPATWKIVPEVRKIKEAHRHHRRPRRKDVAAKVGTFIWGSSGLT